MEHPYMQSLNQDACEMFILDNVRSPASFPVQLLIVWPAGHILLQEGVP
jgi:hypothetical protein